MKGNFGFLLTGRSSHRDTEGEVLPKILKTPLAIAYHLREDSAKRENGSVEENAAEEGDDHKTDASLQTSIESGNGKVRGNDLNEHALKPKSIFVQLFTDERREECWDD